MALISFILLPLAPILAIGFLHKFRNKLKEKPFKMKFVTLYYGINVKRPFARLVIPLFLIRRLIFAIAAVVLDEHTAF